MWICIYNTDVFFCVYKYNVDFNYNYDGALYLQFCSGIVVKINMLFFVYNYFIVDEINE